VYLSVLALKACEGNFFDFLQRSPKNDLFFLLPGCSILACPFRRRIRIAKFWLAALVLGCSSPRTRYLFPSTSFITAAASSSWPCSPRVLASQIISLQAMSLIAIPANFCLCRARGVHHACACIDIMQLLMNHNLVDHRCSSLPVSGSERAYREVREYRHEFCNVVPVFRIVLGAPAERIRQDLVLTFWCSILQYNIDVPAIVL
jgi:hypothetical protein